MITTHASTETVSLTTDSDQRICPVCADTHPTILLTAPDRFHGRRTQYQLLRCSACSLVWLHDPPPPFEMGKHYGSDYDRAIADAKKAPDHWFSRRDKLLRHKSGGAILDMGCAAGGFLSTLKGPSWKLFGIEMSEDAAEAARI